MTAPDPGCFELYSLGLRGEEQREIEEHLGAAVRIASAG
jgi:hypothetical protein